MRLVFAICLSTAVFAADTTPLELGRRELQASRYQKAIEVFTPLTGDKEIASAAYLGIVQAHLNLHNAKEAIAAANQALRLAPESPDALTAAGLAAYRQGEIHESELKFRAALKVDPKHALALNGLADVYATVSLYKSARDLRKRAHDADPDDLRFAGAYFETLDPKERIASLEEELAHLDPSSEDAAYLRVRIAIAKSLGGRKLRVLQTPYEATTLKLVAISGGPHTRAYAVGVIAKLNGKSVRFMLDTGASGISITPKAAERIGLENLTTLTTEARGIGDGKSAAEVHYLADEVRIGSVAYSNYPVSAFRSANSSNYEGLIGADFFRDFLITLDFSKLEITLETRAKSPAEEAGPFDRQMTLSPGFFRVYRFGNHLAMPTVVNEGKPVLFLMDTGASTNLIDVATARSHTKVRSEYDAKLSGIQGEVNKLFNAKDITLTFAGFRQPNPDLLALDLAKMSDGMGAEFGGILGIPVMAAFRITIDYREGAVKLELRKELKR